MHAGENEVAALQKAVELTGKKAVHEERAKHDAETELRISQARVKALQAENEALQMKIAAKDAYFGEFKKWVRKQVGDKTWSNISKFFPPDTGAVNSAGGAAGSANSARRKGSQVSFAIRDGLGHMDEHGIFRWTPQTPQKRKGD